MPKDNVNQSASDSIAFQTHRKPPRHPEERTTAEIFHDRQCSRYALLASMIASKAAYGDKKAMNALISIDLAADAIGVVLPGTRL